MLEKLRKQRAAAVARMKAITETAEADDRDLTEEEREEFDTLDAKQEALKADIQRAERLEATEAELDQPAPTVAQRQGTAPRGPEPKKEFESFGQFMHAVRFNHNDQRLVFHEANDHEIRGALEMETGASGGFAVPTQFRSELLQVSPQSAVFRPRAMVIPAGDPPDSAVTMPALDQSGTTGPANMFGGASVVWVTEGGTKTETDVDLREITLTPHEVAAYITVTDKLLRNWQAASAVLSRLMRQAIVSAEEFAFLSGTGAGKPLGLTIAAASYSQARGTSSTFVYTDAVNMVSRLFADGAGSPVWIMSPQLRAQLMQMRNYDASSPALGDGALVFQPSAREGIPDMLLGYPVVYNQRSPALGSKGDVILADLNYYLIKDGSGPFVASSEHVNFTSNKTIIKAFWNVDGQPWLSTNLNLENDYDVSPFVVLAA